MRLSDIQHKDIISMTDGKKIGNIIDMRIDLDGTITSIIVEPSRKPFKFLIAKEEVEIKWSNIIKIGEDVILVNIS